MARLAQVLRGIRRQQAERGDRKREQHPISPEVMMWLWSSWQKSPGFDATMLWAAVCMCYLAGEITAPERGSFDPGAHLIFSDVTVDSLHQPRRVRIMVKQSKTDPFREGTDIYLGWTATTVPCVGSPDIYGEEKGGGRPLFRFEDGRALMRPALVLHVKRALEAVRVSSVGFSGQNFRIGAATTAVEHGVEDSVVKYLES